MWAREVEIVRFEFVWNIRGWYTIFQSELVWVGISQLGPALLSSALSVSSHLVNSHSNIFLQRHHKTEGELEFWYAEISNTICSASPGLQKVVVQMAQSIPHTRSKQHMKLCVHTIFFTQRKESRTFSTGTMLTMLTKHLAFLDGGVQVAQPTFSPETW